MFDQIKWYLVNVGIKKYAPVAMMSGIAALGTLMAAHAGMLETWGVNYIASWSADWLTTHQISGPILLIELDTTSTAAIAGLIGLIGLMSRATEHHTVGALSASPPEAGGSRATDPPAAEPPEASQ